MLQVASIRRDDIRRQSTGMQHGKLVVLSTLMLLLFLRRCNKKRNNTLEITTGECESKKSIKIKRERCARRLSKTKKSGWQNERRNLCNRNRASFSSLNFIVLKKPDHKFRFLAFLGCIRTKQKHVTARQSYKDFSVSPIGNKNQTLKPWYYYTRYSQSNTVYCITWKECSREESVSIPKEYVFLIRLTIRVVPIAPAIYKNSDTKIDFTLTYFTLHISLWLQCT